MADEVTEEGQVEETVTSGGDTETVEVKSEDAAETGVAEEGEEEKAE